jgi:hypothetical protein
VTTAAWGVCLLLVCVVASSAVIVSGFRRLDARDAGDRLLRTLSAAAITAVGSVVLELMHTQEPGPVLRAGADVAVVLGPVIVWLGLRAVRARALGPLAIAAAGVAAVAGASFLVPRPESFAALLVVMALFCVLGVVETFRAPMRAVRGAIVVRAGLGLFAAYAVAAVATGAITGWRSDASGVITGWDVWAIVSGTAMLTIAIGALLLVAGLRATALPPAGDADRIRPLRALIPDFDLLPGALGTAQASAFDTALVRAARDVDPGARRIRPGVVEVDGGERREVVEQRLQVAFAAALSAHSRAVMEPLVFEDGGAAPGAA